jgi:hypothetical protein
VEPSQGKRVILTVFSASIVTPAARSNLITPMCLLLAAQSNGVPLFCTQYIPVRHRRRYSTERAALSHQSFRFKISSCCKQNLDGVNVAIVCSPQKRSVTILS